MRIVKLVTLGALLLASPVAARAGVADIFFDASVGVPWRTSPDVSRMPTNIMLTPGVLLINWVSAEFGVVAGVAQFGQPARVAIRPMVGLYPPVLPLYAKLVVDIDNLNLAGGLPVITTVGGALGLQFHAGPIRLFLEGDYLPEKVSGQNLNIVEARAGLGYKF
ncbi:MAG TPA: hypothetical protein VMK42_18995 [Anaeromyxobacteraceae bacterium]|nr:hypothetical protein [Anaeromyxobacteraceae bacterium]